MRAGDSRASRAMFSQPAVADRVMQRRPPALFPTDKSFAEPETVLAMVDRIQPPELEGGQFLTAASARR